MTKPVKIFRNPERNKAPEQFRPYVPNYQERGLEPGEHKKKYAPNQSSNNINQTGDNPRLKRNPMINNGNNVDQVWSSGLDAEIFNDLEAIDPNHPMIDNNDFVDLDQPEQRDVSEKYSIFNFLKEELSENEYILMVEDTIICVGEIKEVEAQANALMFGEHKFCNNQPIPVDSLMILKKMKIKTGLFLE